MDHTAITTQLEAIRRCLESEAFEECRGLCHALLEQEPLCFEARFLLGVALHKEHRFHDAATAIGRAIGTAEELARRLGHSGRTTEAEEIRSGQADRFVALGDVFRSEGTAQNAVECYERAIGVDSRHQDARTRLAGLMIASGRMELAIALFEKATREHGDVASFWFELGTLLTHVGRNDEAVIAFEKTVDLDPRHGIAWSNLGTVYQEHDEAEKARACFLEAARLCPDVAEIQNNLGLVYREEKRFEEAIAAFSRSIELNPENGAAHTNLGAIYKDRDELGTAEVHFRRARELEPQSARNTSSLAITLAEQGQFDEAEALHQEALQLGPELADVHRNHSILRLLRGDLAVGWEEYRWRPAEHSTSLLNEIPEWDGRALPQGTLLVTAEQGIGDEIMFASCLEDVAERAAGCMVECEGRLVPVFSRSFPGIHCMPKPLRREHLEAWTGAPIEAWVPIGSLPRFFRGSEAAFGGGKPFLAADPALTKEWKTRFGRLGRGPRVGISWRGGAKLNNRLRKSTALEEWDAVLRVPEVQFVNLQYGETAEELAAARMRTGATLDAWEDLDPLEDMDGFFAQVAALDLVISVSNVSVHTAASMGVPTWVVLPSIPDWRWQLERKDSPWYSSVRLFRQQTAGEWHDVFRQVAMELRMLVLTSPMKAAS